MQLTPATSEALEYIYRLEVDTIRRGVQRRNRDVCHGIIDQAVQDTFLHCYRRPAAFNHAFEDAGLEGLRRLVRFAALCKLREYQRRRYYRAELHIKPPSRTWITRGPDEEHQAAELWRLRLPAAIREAALRCGRRRHDAVEDALWYRLATAESDEEAAERFCVPRKYVQRGRCLVRELLAA